MRLRTATTASSLPDISAVVHAAATSGSSATTRVRGSRAVKRLPAPGDHFAWFPFAGATALNVLGFFGMAYSFYPFIVPEKLTIAEAAAAPESLTIILVGTLFVLPVILGYTVMAYTIFRGKATALRYD